MLKCSTPSISYPLSRSRRGLPWLVNLLGRAEAWLEERPLFTTASAGYILPRHRVHDIDLEEDWILAEAMFRALRQTR